MTLTTADFWPPQPLGAIIFAIDALGTREMHQTAMRVPDKVLRLAREWIPN